jgi:tripartite ATP-independent transporter DctM subunit
MELVFLGLLVLFMVLALTAGFPVSFALPGSAVLAIALAALCGWLFAGDASAYFAQGGPIEWLSAGVTNFRSLYWDVERDTLIAIPLFVFMGIMLQRSKIAEDLLVKMAQLFGPIPGGLGISVVFVGALLAATTGIVGATVIAMGLISLPAMLRNNYSKPLACGTICASGTLGQIIPPSIVLIILADQLSSATDQASTARKADFKEATGEFSMPAEFDITSASAGDMFMGAFVPGMILVGIYMLYILISALIRPQTAPPVHREGSMDREFIVSVLLALVPPLTLIFAVLGSIILGIATVNQAGAIGAIGAMIMAGYRLTAGQRNAFYPAILALVSLAGIMGVLSVYDLNIKNVQEGDVLGLVLAAVFVTGLMVAVLWSCWRAYVIEDTLRGTMIETAKTTSMVFIILIGAAMLTTAFRGFGGEELVKEHLTGLPGGFWGQFVVVMLVIFLLGFFLDFIEIAVVVVPIVAPILLADPSANITAVWLGVMVGLNIQTSFLTPPFGFALFYLRGVAPPAVKTLDIYRGAVAFICLQLAGLAIAGAFPSLVNYLPYRTYLTSDTAPPPMNPRLQACIEEFLFDDYDARGDAIRGAIRDMRSADIGYLPDDWRKSLPSALDQAESVFDLVADVRAAEQAVADATPEYRPVHQEVRALQRDINALEAERKAAEQTVRRLERYDTSGEITVAGTKERIGRIEQELEALRARIPAGWDDSHERFRSLLGVHKKALLTYRRTVDSAYEPIMKLRTEIVQGQQLAALEGDLTALADVVAALDEQTTKERFDEVQERFKQVERAVGGVEGSKPVRAPLAKARRALRATGNRKADPVKARALVAEALQGFATETAWRSRAARDLQPALAAYDATIADTIGLRMQSRLSLAQAKTVAACQAHHEDVSLHF